ncbi:hypothetical protein EXIGLDRAFT_670609 [Exidia glandulosa HHB12029]|uniref:non-specific serine/threonine protein kinase n=1 Tax=Exidia glandulosa HHB12029 TaxID=1314781 RepID=A0A165KVR5_EXIGL|nr:hypothetical protein EXIGLDRAFT_670609 [Exidia glandulosa HHB12029]
MAQFGYPAQGKDLLVFGQAITVGEYTVKVERHLSQGGFAHVYLVRTEQPVGGTTQHVLKHIRVAHESLLNEVKVEVDVMRKLRGHPNIVNLIDAAWSKHPSGSVEVFILMEFCPGGGIIDMMNRRLRERLTEAEILQIFVDVCEGVACMHSRQPAMLHRDLKVENILQASATKYKLCDFGSTCNVALRPPSTLQEIQALGADLDRHTTLQYRAPEMIDPNLRRPIDEKSDVWALGVLLYKLCYYTTPFEEHGPLAILNVQYTTPPYPVYSPQMNQLIGSMLREYGAHRPTVFELLARVHAMRGTHQLMDYKPSPSLPSTSPIPPPTSSLDGILVRSNKDQAGNGAAAARKQVLDAIAPMRRGRPETSADDRAWEAVKAKSNMSDPWDVQLKRVDAAKSPPVPVSSPAGAPGFGDSFKPSVRTAHATSPVPPVQSPPSSFPASSYSSPAPPAKLPTPSQYPNVLRAPSAPMHLPQPPPPVTSPPVDPSSLSAEERFPSLDELDRAFSGNANFSPPSLASPPAFAGSSAPSLPARPSGLTPAAPLRGARSQQVTGVAMKEAAKEGKPLPTPALPTGHDSSPLSPTARPSLRRHRSSVAIKSPVLSSYGIPASQSKPAAPAPASTSTSTPDWLTGNGHQQETSSAKLQKQRDWLTGDNEDFEPAPPAPSVTRSSLNGPRPMMGPRPLPSSPAKSAMGRSTSPKPPLPPRQRAESPEAIKEETPSAFLRSSAFRNEPSSSFKSETASVFKPSQQSSSAFKRSPAGDSSSRPLPVEPVRTSPAQTGLTDNWSPVEQYHPRTDKNKRKSSSSSSSDDEKGPEEALPEVRRSVLEPKVRKSKIRPKGRTSSVHDLVDLWSTTPAEGKAEAYETQQPSPPKPERPPSVQTQRPPSRLERPPSVQGYAPYGQKRSPAPSPVLRPSPMQPAPPSPAKARPQSMFAYGGGSSLGPPSSSAQQTQPAKFTALQHQTPNLGGLAAPAPDPAKLRAGRRGSISDMVDKYEALASPRSPTGPRWSPSAAQTTVPLPGLATPSQPPVGRTSPGLFAPQQRRVSTGRISPALSTTSSSTASTSAFQRRQQQQQPLRKNTAPAASPTKPVGARPPSPSKAAFDFGAPRTGTPMSGSGTPPPHATTPRPMGTVTPKPHTTGTGVKPTSTGMGVRSIVTGTGLKSTTTGSGVKPLATGSSVKPLSTGGFAGLKPITTGTGVKTSSTGAGLKSPTIAGSGVGPGHSRNSSTSVLFGNRIGTPVPSSPVTLVSPIPTKPVSLSRRPVNAPPLKPITPPRELNGGGSTTGSIGASGATPQHIASPTPDRPYSGVSKLIDQWQRKTEESAQAPTRKLKG